MLRPTPVVLCAIALFTLAAAPGALAEKEVTGHCRYKQYAPKLRLWYPACQMPASSKAECEALISAYRAQVEYGEGACSQSGVAAVCEAGGTQIFFYKGKPADLQRGCERFLRGAWRADLVPAQ